MHIKSFDVAIHRVCQRFGMLLRREVTQTLSSEKEVEDEIRYLISIVGS